MDLNSISNNSNVVWVDRGVDEKLVLDNIFYDISNLSARQVLNLLNRSGLIDLIEVNYDLYNYEFKDGL